MKHPVDLKLITDAAFWWSSRGFRETAVPAMVCKEVMDHTSPPGAIDLRLEGFDRDCVVASAEQSFLQLELDGELSYGDWMALTPCYRYETNHDEIHLPVFLKLELFSLPEEKDEKEMQTAALRLATKFQDMFFDIRGIPTEIKETTEGWDAYYRGIELGSFGVRRTLRNQLYLYGTGIAEPRASFVIQKHSEGEIANFA